MFYNTQQVEVSANLSCVCDSQTVKCSNSDVDDLFAPQSFHHLRLAHMDVSAMAQTEVVAFPPVLERKRLARGQIMEDHVNTRPSVSPCPHHSGFGESQGELCSTFNLADALSVESLYVLWDVAALTASTTKLSKVPITPGEHQP